MKLHLNVLLGIIECLHHILNENKYTEDVLEKVFKKNKQWGSRDRRFIAEAVFDIIRWKRLLEYMGNLAVDDKEYREKILGVYLSTKGWSPPSNYPIIIPEHEFNIQQRSDALPLEIKESIPDWLHDLGKKELSSEWPHELEALNTPASVILRVNTLKISKEKLKSLLLEQGIETEEIAFLPNALQLIKRQSLTNLSAYKDGFFEIQDGGSQYIAPFLQVKPGDLVIDACAGAGGKTLHLASLMENKGKIVAMDVEERKLRVLQERATRANAKIIKTTVIAPKTLESLSNTADKLLLDVPCSGLGVLKRNPDDKWKLTMAGINKLKETQLQILTSYTSMVKKGGTVVYATCSILPSENQQQVQRFLEIKKGEYELIEEKQILPSQGFDGFYMARLLKI